MIVAAVCKRVRTVRGRTAATRAAWTVIDQGVSSVTNFALGVFAARMLSLRAFGAFSVALAVYLLALGVSRALCSEPLIVRFSAKSPDVARPMAQDSVGCALLVGAAAGCACIAAGMALGGSVRFALFVLGPLLPGLLAQDAWRYVFVAEGRPARAAFNDSVWAAAQVLCFVLVLGSDHRSVGFVLAAWALPASFAAVVGAMQFGSAPRVSAAPSWLVGQRELGPRFVGEFIASTGGAQLTMLALGAVAGASELGALRAGLVVVSPLNILVIAASTAAVPEGVRLRQRSLSALRLLCVGASVVVATAALMWAGAVLAVPGLGRSFVGGNWQAARPMVLPLAIVMAASGAGVGAQIGLRALAAARRSLSVRLATLPVMILGGLGGAILSGASGTAYALAAAYLLSALLGWKQLSRAIGEERDAQPTVAPPIVETFTVV